MPEQREKLEWWRWSPYHLRFVLGVGLVLLGFLWRIRGPIGHVEVQNERVPDVRAADFLIVPMMAVGFLLISSRPGVRLVDRVVGIGMFFAAGIWLVTKHPFQGRIVWNGPSQHGVHVGDLAAVVPILLGLQILIRSRVPPPRYPADELTMRSRHDSSEFAD
jgi:hypothetical protein